MVEPTTTGQNLNYTIHTGAQQGWQCPVCKKILAPWLPECPCNGIGQQTTIISEIKEVDF